MVPLPRTRGRTGSAIRPPFTGEVSAQRTEGARLMANLQIVETSLRDGNQCLWGALGVTTANTLTIAPVAANPLTHVMNIFGGRK